MANHQAPSREDEEAEKIMSTKKSPEETRHDELLAAINAVKAPLSALALVALIDEFHSKEERQKLHAEYADLREKDHAAYEALHAAGPTIEPDLGWESRVKKYGEDVAREHLLPKTDALEAKKVIYEQVVAFERRNPMIKRLHRLQSEIGKASWEQ